MTSAAPVDDAFDGGIPFVEATERISIDIFRCPSLSEHRSATNTCLRTAMHNTRHGGNRPGKRPQGASSPATPRRPGKRPTGAHRNRLRSVGTPRNPFFCCRHETIGEPEKGSWTITVCQPHQRAFDSAGLVSA
jgi:hypothetical protein